MAKHKDCFGVQRSFKRSTITYEYEGRYGQWKDRTKATCEAQARHALTVKYIKGCPTKPNKAKILQGMEVKLISKTTT